MDKNYTESRPVRVLLLGGVIIDRCFEVDRYPLAGQDAGITDSYNKIGGCALNMAVTLDNLGDRPYLVSMIGEDPGGQKIREYIGGLELPLDGIVSCHGEPTGFCLNMIDPSGERTFFTSRGCEGRFSKSMLLPDLARKVSWVYVTGYYLLDPDSAGQVVELISGMKSTGCSVLFDPGPLVQGIEPGIIRDMVSLSDWSVPNLEETFMIRDRVGFDKSPVNWFQDLGCRNLVVKKGRSGAEVYTDDLHFRVTGFTVESRDTTGAGDSFAGGLIHALSRGRSPGDSVKFACACGALTTSFQGPHGRFSLEDVNQLVVKDNEI
ncbi:carbohydrate kinase family protein [Desulfospira joergensenii]|uniref:carbohydrate kinase family protein n=1 Tax=Desulfospira joergensenii TaxID=53329 RepID=UPI0003B3C509|nr:carbohydrate kinase family protein [Desulfospira joergensenii]